MSTFAVIMVAAGKSSRFQHKHYKKPFAPLDGRAVWLHSAERFLNRDDTKQLILVIAAEDQEQFDFKFSSNVAILDIDVVHGGAQRADSVQAGLEQVKAHIEFVCVHDAARPCLADAWIDRIYQAAVKSDAAIFALPIAGTIKRVGDRHIVDETVPREGLWEAQTPQVFRRELLVEAYAKRAGFAATDEAQLVERLGRPVTVVPGSPINLKIATQEDMRLAEKALKAVPRPKPKLSSHPFADDDMWR